MNLTIRPESGLEVIIPQRFSRAHIPKIIEDNRSWIDGALARWAESQALLDQSWPPELLSLNAIDINCPIEYAEVSENDPPRCRRKGELFYVTGDYQNKSALKRVLEAELKKLAREELQPWIEALSEEHQLPFSRLSIRGQKGRWGSCSSKKSINLNYKLLFLPPELVEYVLLHELAHTRHMDHSAAFWQFVSSLLPQAQLLDLKLKNIDKYLPSWI